MQRNMLKSKLHRARVTDANPEYEGSIEIDQDLMDVVGLISYEQVHIYDITNGNRLITYVIPGQRGSGVISLNGAAARLVHINDRIIIAAYAIIDTEREIYAPKVVLLNADNQVVEKNAS